MAFTSNLVRNDYHSLGQCEHLDVSSSNNPDLKEERIRRGWEDDHGNLLSPPGERKEEHTKKARNELARNEKDENGWETFEAFKIKLNEEMESMESEIRDGFITRGQLEQQRCSAIDHEQKIRSKRLHPSDCNPDLKKERIRRGWEDDEGNYLDV